MNVGLGEGGSVTWLCALCSTDADLWKLEHGADLGRKRANLALDMLSVKVPLLHPSGRCSADTD